MEMLRTGKKDFQTGKVAGSGPPPTPVPETVPFVAEENILEFVVVLSTGIRADSNIITSRNKAIGINTANVLDGFVGQAKSFGSITNPAWTWVKGDRIFLNGTSLSTVPPVSGYCQFIGNATAADTIDVQILYAILL